MAALPWQQQARPPVGQPPSAAPPSGNVTIFTNLYVSNIPAGLEDPYMAKILNIAGPLRKWKRVTDASGVPKSFGFAEYADAQGVFRALRLLNGVELKSHDGVEVNKLSLKADTKTRAYLDSISDDSVDEAKDQQMLATLRKFISPVSEVDMLLGSLTAEPLNDKWSAEKKEVIVDQITMFRQREAERVRRKEAVEAREAAENEARRLRRQQEDHSREDQRRPHRHDPRRRDGAPAFVRGEHQPMSTQREPERPQVPTQLPGYIDVFASRSEEADFREQKELAKERKYRERLRKFEVKEEMRLQHLKEEEASLLAQEEKAKSAKEEAKAYYANLNDGDPEVRRTDFYYKDRDAWMARRRRFREAEERADERERRLEQEEAEMQRRRDEVASQREREASARTEEAADAGRVKLSLGGQRDRKRAIEMDTEEEESKTRRRLMPDLTFTDAELKEMGYTDEQIVEKRKEERANKMKGLVSIIPSDKEGLWKWPVKWEALSEQLLKEKITPFIRKKMSELLAGEADDDLVEYFCDALKQRTKPNEILEELNVALGDEAEVFVMKVWRMMIFETENQST